MPEGSEVKILTEQLSKAILGKKITYVIVLGGRFIKNRPEGITDFKIDNPTGCYVTKVACRGKFIYIGFGNNYYLWNTLGMTGHWGPNQEKHSAIELRFENAPSVFFTDPRRFGTVHFRYGEKWLWDKLNTFGLDYLNPTPNDKLLNPKPKVMKSKKTLAEILMDQSIWCGIGNYIKSESLFLAELSPWRTGNSLSDAEYEALDYAVHSILIRSYKAGGATLATYKQFDGSVGKYSEQLLVYDQKEWDGKPIKKETTSDGRTSFWVPGHQV